MKINTYLFLILWLFAFTYQIKEEPIVIETKEILNPEFQKILDEAGVEGAILVYDFKNKTYFSNDFDHAKSEFIPASTFKIPNSLIALETGVVKDGNVILEWDGITRGITSWNQDLSFKQAFHYSCVPCYQEIAREVGPDRMREYLAKLQYDSMDVKSENIDMFWLEGKSKISQMRQIDFLKRFQKSELPISERTERIAKEMMTVRNIADERMIAKTGLSLSGVGWYVGYVEKGDNVFFFATNLEIKDASDRQARISVTNQALQLMGISEQRP